MRTYDARGVSEVRSCDEYAFSSSHVKAEKGLSPTPADQMNSSNCPRSDTTTWYGLRSHAGLASHEA